MHDTASSLLAAAARFAASAKLLAHADGADDDLAPEVAEILTVMGEEPEWRVFVDGTRNLGHQASTVTLLRRLIDLVGFGGRVVVVYADHGQATLGCTAQKLALMFAGLDPSRIDEAVACYGACEEIRFLPFKRRSELQGATAFGFTGGADNMFVNYALELNVRFFVRLQPYLWDDEPNSKSDAYYQSSRIEQPDGSHFYLVDAYPSFRHLPIKQVASSVAPVDPRTWDWYCYEQKFVLAGL